MLHFLIAEDDDDHAELVLRSLRRSGPGLTAERVSNGVEAMAYLHGEGAHAGKPRPGIILLDLNMPRLGGHEVLERVKADPELRAIPVVILSTSDAEPDRRRAYDHHANSYLVKPADFTKFSEMIGEVSRYWGVWNRPVEGG